MQGFIILAFIGIEKHQYFTLTDRGKVELYRTNNSVHVFDDVVSIYRVDLSQGSYRNKKQNSRTFPGLLSVFKDSISLTFEPILYFVR